MHAESTSNVIIYILPFTNSSYYSPHTTLFTSPPLSLPAALSLSLHSFLGILWMQYTYPNIFLYSYTQTSSIHSTGDVNVISIKFNCIYHVIFSIPPALKHTAQNILTDWRGKNVQRELKGEHTQPDRICSSTFTPKRIIIITKAMIRDERYRARQRSLSN